MNDSILNTSKYNVLTLMYDRQTDGQTDNGEVIPTC